MISYLDTGNKRECSGCGACEAACGKRAITMLVDAEGFRYPLIEKQKCVACGRCRTVCLAGKEMTLHKPIAAYAAVCREEDKLLLSASGGAFYAITRACADSTRIYGAAWTDRSHVAHLGADARDAYERFRKSKYVQSDVTGILSRIRSDLREGREVVFTGTPCQVAGLKAYLNRDDEKLLTVDLVCHGVSNSELLEKCLTCFDRKDDKVSRASFRHKMVVGDKWNSKLLKLVYQSGKEVILDYNTCGFLRGYDNGLFFRPSCSVCPYAQVLRTSDITIGDFWGGEQLGYDPQRGTSLILVNSSKGRTFFEKMQLYLNGEQISLDFAAEHNARLRKPDKGSPQRKHFFGQLELFNFEDAVQHVLPRIPKWKVVAHKMKEYLLHIK
ncbi:MAG: Coenzyme F420 hydrogenase/dehydrogenase, beta subunit C-terminal domain [Faecousia sp.]